PWGAGAAQHFRVKLRGLEQFPGEHVSVADFGGILREAEVWRGGVPRVVDARAPGAGRAKVDGAVLQAAVGNEARLTVGHALKGGAAVEIHLDAEHVHAGVE